MGENEDVKDLNAFFEKISTSLEETTKQVGAISTKLEELEKNQGELAKKVEEQEKERPYGAPYGVPFIKSVLKLIAKLKPKNLDDLKDRLAKMAGYTTEQLEAELGEQEGTYPAPVIAKVLRYLKGKLSKREFSHVVRLLGAGTEAEDLIEAVLEGEEESRETYEVVLPGMVKETFDDKEKAIDKIVEFALNYGREHQK